MSRLAVIVPVYNGISTLGDCIKALQQSRRIPDELIVVDDSSTDHSGELSEKMGARVYRMEGGPAGPAKARNIGASLTNADILVFIDADVTVHPDTLEQIEKRFREDSQIDALFGSYDDDPADQGIVSRYKNLLHHHVHQNSSSKATTFWAGCGAVKRIAFETVGGFKESYRTASIEDIELGDRLAKAGFHIRLCPEILCKHLKRWTFTGLIRCDVFQRAVPWSNLIKANQSIPNDLNLGWSNRLGALAAWLFAFCLISLYFFPAAAVGAGAAGGAVLACNLGLFRMFFFRCGLVFSFCAFLLHLIYLIYSSGIFAVIVGPSIISRRVSSPAASPKMKTEMQ